MLLIECSTKICDHKVPVSAEGDEAATGGEIQYPITVPADGIIANTNR